jgi:hypothetical protein
VFVVTNPQGENGFGRLLCRILRRFIFVARLTQEW